MFILLQLILLVCCIAMFFVKREYKIALLLLVLICFTFVHIPWIPYGSASYLIANSFLLSEIPYWGNHINKIRKTFFWIILSLMIIATIICFFNSPHYEGPKGLFRIFDSDLFIKYFFVVYAFLCVHEEKEMTPLMRSSYYALLVLTFFAILNLITRQAILLNIEELMHDRADVLYGDFYTTKDRFRVQSMFVNPFDYGYICLVLLTFHFWGFSKNLLKKKQFYISLACCLFGVYTCNCRTVTFCLVIGVIAFVMLRYNLKKKLKYSLLVILLGWISYIFVPIVQEKVDQSLSVFDYESTAVGGSSLEARALQYATVFDYIQGHEMFGRGAGYFTIDLGWADTSSNQRDENLYGLEGVFMSLFLERGYFGTIFYLLFYCILFYFLYKHRKQDTLSASIGMTLLITYFAFANMTGELSSVPPTLLIVGCMVTLLLNKPSQKALDK